MVHAVTLADRPDLYEASLSIGVLDHEFLQHDLVGVLRGHRFERVWAEHSVVLVDGDEVVGRAFGVPFASRGELPDHGWDGAVVWAAEDALDGRPCDTVCALDVMVDERRRGTGLAPGAVDALRANTARLGMHELVCPVRPAAKAAEPFTPWPSTPAVLAATAPWPCPAGWSRCSSTRPSTSASTSSPTCGSGTGHRVRPWRGTKSTASWSRWWRRLRSRRRSTT